MVDDVLEALREATYATPSGKQILYNSGGDLTRQVADLYAVVNENHVTGSSNLENDQLRAILTDLAAGKPDLSDAQWGLVQRLLEKYKDELAAARKSPDRNGQDYSAVPPEGTGRVVPPDAGRDGRGRFKPRVG